MPNRHTFYERVSGEHLQCEEWWFLHTPERGEPYVTVQRYSIDRDGRSPVAPLTETFSVEAVLAEDDDVTAALHLVLPACCSTLKIA